MNIMLYGNAKAVFEAEEWLSLLAEITQVCFFQAFPPAQEYLTHHSVDMIFLDADDTATDWEYLVQKFREINSKTKIVLLSSNTNQSVRAYEVGVFDYLLKPVKKKQLERVVSKSGYKQSSL